MFIKGLKNLMCPERDSNPHSRKPPPPQDGVSTSFTIWATFSSKFKIQSSGLLPL
jgi:hypothetical protein